jgi:hypothetical protein
MGSELYAPWSATVTDPSHVKFLIEYFPNITNFGLVVKGASAKMTSVIAITELAAMMRGFSRFDATVSAPSTLAHKNWVEGGARA